MEFKNIDTITKPADLKKYVKEFMFHLKEEYFSGWPDFTNKANEIIQNDTSKKHITALDYSSWRRKHSKEIALDRDSVYFWKEFYNIVLLKIYNENGGNTAVKKSIHEKINHSHEKKTIVRYGVFPCQDTILPLFFEELYNDLDFEVEFITFKDWNDGLEAFQNNKIDVALHNFPTTVAFNSELNSESPLFFWPFFSFKGYSLWVRTTALKDFVTKNKITKPLFDNWSKEEKKRFFQEAKILVEKNTDFEWVLIDYLKEGLGCTKDEIAAINKKCIHACNTNTAKGKFVSDKKFTVYVTNPIHTFDLKQPKYKSAFTLLLHGNDFTHHNNFNGLICSDEYYHEHEDIIHKLIEKWFLHTDALKKRISQLTKKNPLSTSKQTVSITIPSLIAFLNKETVSEIKDEHLQYIYDPSYNMFYDNHTKAFKDFYETDLGNEKIIQNYIGITQMELDKGSDNADKIREVINAIKNNMIKL